MDFQQLLQHGFRNLLNFDGREGRQQFLVYSGTVFAALLTLSVFLFLEDALSAVRAFQAFEGNKQNINQMGWSSSALAAYWEERREMTERLHIRLWIDGGKFVFVGLILPLMLTLSSLIRRLHDIGFSAKILLLVIPVSLFLPFMPLLLLALVAGLPSEEEANQYGEALSP